MTWNKVNQLLSTQKYVTEDHLYYTETFTRTPRGRILVYNSYKRLGIGHVLQIHKGNRLSSSDECEMLYSPAKHERRDRERYFTDLMMEDML